MIIDDTKISFTKEMYDKAETLFLDSVDTGFLNLYLFSDLTLYNNTEISGLLASKNAVMSASAQSNVYMRDTVKFIDNNAQSADG